MLGLELTLQEIMESHFVTLPLDSLLHSPFVSESRLMIRLSFAIQLGSNQIGSKRGAAAPDFMQIHNLSIEQEVFRWV